MKKRSLKNALLFLFSLLICQLAGIVGSIFTRPAINDWYIYLKKPDIAPPSWIFAPVWTVLFLLMGVSLFLLIKSKNNQKALGAFFIQLILNVFWSIMFFGARNPMFAFIEILFLWITILATIVYSYRISKTAAWLLAPYLLWVSFAMLLNYSYWVINS